MVLSALCGLLLLSQQPAAKPATLSRVFQAKQKFTYDVSSHLGLESRPRGMETFMPEDFDLNYSFTAQVMHMKADGIAVVRYLRPTVTQVEGETWDSPPKTRVEKINWDFLLTVSPINQILETVDQKRKAPATKKPAKWMLNDAPVQGGGDPIAQFLGDLYRLSLFVGPVETSLDFSPKLPITEVIPGDTWKQTVGYQPQRLKGKAGMAVQRLDYTYAYKGRVSINGKTYERVVASLALNSDLADWARQYMGPEEGQGPKLTRLPLRMNAKIEFNLDPKTFHTVSAEATSEGGFEVFLSDAPKSAIYERKLHGRTNLQLRSITLVSG